MLVILQIIMRKKIYIALFCLLAMAHNSLLAQCSICTKTASQLGDGPAQGLNSAIVYLMFTPLAIMGFIGYRWWKRENGK
jgi:hypothetical protein